MHLVIQAWHCIFCTGRLKDSIGPGQPADPDHNHLHWLRSFLPLPGNHRSHLHSLRVRMHTSSTPQAQRFLQMWSYSVSLPAGSCVVTTLRRSSSIFRWRCWASIWSSWSTPGCPPGRCGASVWLWPWHCTTSCWRLSPGWDWRPFTCTLPWSRSSTSTCRRTFWSSAWWDGVSGLLLCLCVAPTVKLTLSCSLRGATAGVHPGVLGQQQGLRQQPPLW